MVSIIKKTALSIQAVAFGVAFSASAAMASDFRMLASWDGSYPVVPNVAEVYMDMVKDASDGKTTIAMTGPEAVPPFEQLQPVRLLLFFFFLLLFFY